MKEYKNKLITFLLIVSFLFSVFTIYVYSDADFTVSARAAALYEPETKSFLYKKDFNRRLPMASTTKIMTALLALEILDIEKNILVDDRAVGTDGSSIYLERGECMNAESLVYALMLGSANDAAEALAYEISGGIEEFSALMNERAESIGAYDTCFKNPHGLDAAGHYTTAHDLALISAEALRNESFRKICSTYKKTIESNIKTRVVVNHNKLLKMYDGCIGVKTGYTQLSGRSLVSAAERDGLTLISVTIDAPDDWCDHKKLLNHGFNSLHALTLTETGEYKATLPVLSGEKNYTTVENCDKVKIIYKGEKPKITKEVKLDRYLCAPISKGDVVGTIIYKSGNEILGSTNIIASEDIAESRKIGFWQRLFG